MTTVTTVPTILDPGTSYDLTVINTGLLNVQVAIDGGSTGLLHHEILRPGQRTIVYPFGYPVTAYTEAGSSSVSVTTAENPQGDPANEASDLKAADLAGYLTSATASATYVALAGNQSIAGNKTIAGQIIANLLPGNGNDQIIYAESNLTGLSAPNVKAALHIQASETANLDDASHDHNVGAIVYNYTKNGAGLVIGNYGQGDGVFVQTNGTAGGTSYGINLWAGDATNQTAVGTALNIQRYGVGSAVTINGEPGSGTAELLGVTQNVNGRTLLVNDYGSTTADCLAAVRTAATTGPFVNLYHSTSAFSGNGLAMNFGNGGSFTGKFVSFSLAGVEKFYVDSGGKISYTTTTQTGAPVAGGASALPATPAGYADIVINGSNRKLAYY